MGFEVVTRKSKKLLNLFKKKYRFLNVRACYPCVEASVYDSLWAAVAPHAPPGDFPETTIFMNLIHIAIEIRLPAKILMLDKAMRVLFSKWPPKHNKYYNFIILKQICFIFDHFPEQKEKIVQI